MGRSARAACEDPTSCQCESVGQPVLPAEILELEERPNGSFLATLRALEADGAGGAGGAGPDATTPDWPMPGETFGGTFVAGLFCHGTFEAEPSDLVLAVFSPRECTELVDCQRACVGQPHPECTDQCLAETAAACEASRAERLRAGYVQSLPLGESIELSGGILVSPDEALRILTDAGECRRRFPPPHVPCDDEGEIPADGCSLSTRPNAAPGGRMFVPIGFLMVALGLARRRDVRLRTVAGGASTR